MNFNIYKFFLESSTYLGFCSHGGSTLINNCINVDLLYGHCQICVYVYMADFTPHFTQWDHETSSYLIDGFLETGENKYPNEH